MVGIGAVCDYLFPGLQKEYRVSTDKNGTIVEFWNEAKLGPKPTIEFLESKRAEAEAFFAAQEKASQLLAAKKELAEWEIDAICKLVMELRKKLAAKGETLTPVPKELSDKLTAIDSLKAVEEPIGDAK